MRIRTLEDFYYFVSDNQYSLTFILQNTEESVLQELLEIEHIAEPAQEFILKLLGLGSL